MFGPPFAIRAGIYRRVRAGAFGVAGFPSLWSANLAWNVGRWMEQVAIGWIAFELTQSALLVALIGFYRSLPLFLLGIFGGVLGDRYDRRRLILVLQSVNVVTVSILATLTLLNQLTYAEMVLVEVVLGVSQALDWPSRRSLIVDLVGRTHLTNAVALDATGMNVSRTVGAMASGVLIASLSPGTTLAFLACVYLLNAILLRGVPPSPKQTLVRDRNVLRTLSDGVGEVLKDEAIVGVLAVTVVMNFLFFPYQQILPVVAADVLQVGSIGLGSLGAADGLGSLIGALLIATFSTHRRNGLFFWAGSLAGGLALIGFSFARSLSAALLLLFVGGFFRASFSTFQSSIILRKSSDKMRGRAMGILTLAIGVGPFGALEIGALAQAAGTTQAILLNAVACSALVAVIGARLRRFREA